MAHDWHSAYVLQAKSDFRILGLLWKDEAVELCHKLHYLQMVTEKLAKGFLTEPGGTQYPKKHRAFVQFVRVAKSMPSVQRACQFTNKSQFAAYMDRLLVIAKQIEELSPEGHEHPNPEYPWIADRIIYCPVDYPFGDLHTNLPRMIKLMEFIKSCIDIA